MFGGISAQRCASKELRILEMQKRMSLVQGLAVVLFVLLLGGRISLTIKVRPVVLRRCLFCC